MSKRKRQPRRASQEVSDLQGRVAELEETLRAIRMGEVDAVLVSGPEGDQVVLAFTMTPKQADRLGTRDLSLAGSIAFLKK